MAQLEHNMAEFRPCDRVLVAIMNRRRDFEIARDEGWYRVPSKTAPASTTDAQVLAFYFTRAFDEEKWSIRWYCAIQGHELALRSSLIPEQPDHPRAKETYYKLQLGPLLQLEAPVLSLRWRRVTFIETSWDRLMAAEEINDLYTSGADGLYVTLKEAGLHAEREFQIRDRGERFIVDLAIPCRDGTVAISTTERPTPVGALISPGVELVQKAVNELGGALGFRELQ
jgi:hypothetical protein